MAPNPKEKKLFCWYHDGRSLNEEFMFLLERPFEFYSGLHLQVQIHWTRLLIHQLQFQYKGRYLHIKVGKEILGKNLKSWGIIWGEKNKALKKTKKEAILGLHINTSTHNSNIFLILKEIFLFCKTMWFKRDFTL